MFKRIVAAAAMLAAASLATASASFAGFKVCNKSNERASVSVGYNSSEYGWTSEGWWRVPVGDCVSIISGELNSRYYYLYCRPRSSASSIPRTQASSRTI